MYNIPENENIPSHYLIPVSVVVAIFSAIIIMPFDSLKTNMQLYEIKDKKYS
jgi:sporulation protein YlmC with PRC-barrel domain